MDIARFATSLVRQDTNHVVMILYTYACLPLFTVLITFYILDTFKKIWKFRDAKSSFESERFSLAIQVPRELVLTRTCTSKQADASRALCVCVCVCVWCVCLWRCVCVCVCVSVSVSVSVPVTMRPRYHAQNGGTA